MKDEINKVVVEKKEKDIIIKNMTNENLWSKVDTPGFLGNEAHQDVRDQALHALSASKKQ